jgi:hypothetical protein
VKKGRARVYLFMTAVLLVAAFFRLYRLRTIPWGLSQDEVLNIDVATFVRDGYRPIFFQEGFGHEPLFHYLSAATVTLWGENVTGIRVPAVFCGLLLVVLTYVLAQRLLGAPAARVASVGLSISWWPIIFSRLGIRAITLPLVTTMAVYALGRALSAERSPGGVAAGREKTRRSPFPTRWWSLAGLGLGLTWYTYTAGRVLPLLLVCFSAYLALTNRRALHRHGPGLALAFSVTILVIAPLGLYLRAHPGSGQRIEQLNEPLERLSQGDPSLVWASTRTTLGMFSFSGTSRWTYSLQGRPIFEPLGAILFYLGLGLCLVRWRQPVFALLLCWLGLGLAPGALTPESPSIIRTIGALPVVYLLPGVAVSFLWERARGPVLRRGLIAGLVLVAGLNAVWTFRDGFDRWAGHSETYWLYKAHFADIAVHLDAQATPVPLVISETWYDPIDAGGLYRHLQRRDTRVRWAQQGTAFVFPARATQFEVAVTPFSPPWGELWHLFAADAPAVVTSGTSHYEDKLGVTFYSFAAAALKTRLATAATMPLWLPEGGPPVVPPIPLGEEFTFLGYELLGQDVQPGGRLVVLTFWQVQREAPAPTAIFVHLLDPGGQLRGQHDGLDVDVASLQEGDIVVQQHTISVPSDAPTASYRIQVGMYTRADRLRLPVLVNGEPVADRLWLSVVEMAPSKSKP